MTKTEMVAHWRAHLEEAEALARRLQAGDYDPDPPPEPEPLPEEARRLLDPAKRKHDTEPPPKSRHHR